MKRREPPPLAAWMLEHLTSSDRDEALAGDLLEVFRSGRTGSWYWRQVCGACAVSWFNGIRVRLPIFVFALAWSMLAPAWATIIDRFETTSRFYVHIRQLEWPYSGLTEIVTWVGLNLVFLWAGILLYFLVQSRHTRILGKRTIRNAFLKAPAFLLPVYFVTFVLANLLAYPGIAIDRRTITLLGEVTDLRIWADVLRLPYLISLTGALWSAIPRQRRGSQLPPWMLDETAGDSAPTLENTDAYTLGRFFCLTVAAGLINAMIIGVLFCRLPNAHAPGLRSLLMSAASYVLIGALAGVAGSWLYWKSPSSPFRRRSPLPFPLFALVCAAGWVWVTPMLLLAEQVSPATAFAAMIGAFVLAAGLRNASYGVFASVQPQSPRFETIDGELFAESTSRAPFEPYGYIIAISLYAAGAALYTHSNYTASMWLALSAAVFAWKNSIPRKPALSDRERYRRASLRLVLIAIPAVILTGWAMLEGVAQRNRAAAEGAALDAQEHAVKAVAKPNANTSALGSSGFESLILWPYPPKKELIAPVPSARSLLVPGTKQPLILRFDGTYEYIQPPDQRPGLTAHRAHGTPLHVDIASNNDFPVMMHAHQNLPAPIATAACSEIDVEIENADNRAGMVSLGLLLGNGLPGHEQTAYLGQQPIESTEPGRFYIKASPATETLRFAVPANVNLRQFAEITVVVLPDVEHMFVAPRIAIREFRLLPR
ncbi:MAG TPA: hypothetical protein VGI45_33490 [Terracidiphilus sp.]|jgi:hypothetical protein